MTDRAKHIFVVKEFVSESGEPEPWLMLELAEAPDLPKLGGGFLGFDLMPGTTYEEAHILANSMNAQIAFTTYTDPAAEAQRIEAEQADLNERKKGGRLN